MGKIFQKFQGRAFCKVVFCLLIILMLSISAVSAGGQKAISVSGGFGLMTRNSGAPPWFTMGPSFGMGVNIPIKGNWSLEPGFSIYRMYDDRSTSSEFALSTEESDRTRSLNGFDLSLLLKRNWPLFGEKVGLNAGFGAGLSKWKIKDPNTDLVLSTSSDRGGPTDFEASELFLSATLGTDYKFDEKWKIVFNINTNYMTGAGLEFDKAVEDSLGNWDIGAGLAISYYFGDTKDRARWNKIRKRPYTPRESIIKPEIKKETVTESSRPVSSSPNDSDRDGIPDEDDRCPNTPLRALGFVDVHGCPIDSDADSYPDYVDQCPHNPRGAMVDIHGCPIDSDNDGVPDGLDDCPDTSPNLKVDKNGCVDMSLISKPTVLNIRYRENSFDIDPQAMRTLDSIALFLRQAPVVSIEVIGYTDNSGSAAANKKLSEKRANRVRDYLVSLGISPTRISVRGAGGSNFVASNKTETGRQKNRRVELVYSR